MSVWLTAKERKYAAKGNIRDHTQIGTVDRTSDLAIAKMGIDGSYVGVTPGSRGSNQERTRSKSRREAICPGREGSWSKLMNRFQSGPTWKKTRHNLVDFDQTRRKALLLSDCKQMVRKGGLEPPRELPHQILNLARLPNSATFAS